MGHKIVFNGRYGGFFLDKDIIDRYNELAGTNYIDNWDMNDVPRHDKFLVQAVAEYKASGKKTDLFIDYIEGNLYKIDEYDGLETVIEPGDINWIEIEE